ncbi:MAG: inositol monophosphatase [Gammaproteobacteria bacterium]|nr:inositol monophosphatase [Gammaproteobacteria bacterium]
MTETSHTEILGFTLDIAREAGIYIRDERKRANLTHTFKHDNELVTNADLQADRLLCDRITQRFPAHLILSEESSPDLGRVEDIKGPLWIIDPIDGTVNFAHGHIQSAVSVAFVNQQQVQVGVVYNPFTDEMFAAELGKGATLNGRVINVAQQTELSRALIATGFPYDKSNIAPLVARLQAILAHCADIRRLGSAALDICWLAAGRLDGYYESLSVWDFAAAQLVATEAGARFGHFSAVPVGANPQFWGQDILVANPALYPQLLDLLHAPTGS